jgi:DNA-directed RNA polymerase specialized sigma24 family protein
MLTPAHLVEYARVQANPGWYCKNPEEAAIFNESVERKLSVLDERERAAVLLEAQGYTHAEIACRLNWHKKTITRMFHRMDGRLYRQMDAALADMDMKRRGRGRRAA